MARLPRLRNRRAPTDSRVLLRSCSRSIDVSETPPLTSGARPTFSVIRYLRCPLRNGRSLGTRRSSVFREARSDLKKERNGRDLSSGV